MKVSPPVTKIEMIDRSMSCFVLGMCALIPVIGMPFAVASLVQYRRVKTAGTAIWNPAERYLFWGALCARVGLWPILIIAVLLALAAWLFPAALQ